MEDTFKAHEKLNKDLNKKKPKISINQIFDFKKKVNKQKTKKQKQTK